MDFTEGTEFFIDLERAFFETEEGVFGELFALFTDLPFCFVFAVTILFYHHGDEFFLLRPRFQLFLCFVFLRLFHTAPLSNKFAYANPWAKILVRRCEPMG